jgi:hypothetical protein
MKAIALLAEHFTKVTVDWIQIAAAIKEDLDLSDDELLKQRPATRFILNWMWKIRQQQDIFNFLIPRNKQPAISEHFTFAVAITLELFLRGRGHAGRVRCEETIRHEGKTLRPDVSIRSESEAVLATVECKTQLGYKRKSWRDEWDTRLAFLGQSSPTCKPYMCVLTERNWDAKPFITDQLFNAQWFCLSNWRYRKEPSDINITGPIEPMFISIANLLR